jgi:hypothetical protein
MNRFDAKDDWYVYLWNRLYPDARDVPELLRNPLRVVTFNYDRSLEHFLFNAIKNTYSTSEQKALDAVNAFSIVHVYGKLGTYCSEGMTGDRRYRPDNGATDLACASAGIHVLPEARDGSDEFLRAQEWIGEADRIGFMGFGYDPMNCKRLDVYRVLKERRPPLVPAKIFAGTYGLTDSEVGDARKRICRDCPWTPMSVQNLALLRESGLLL